MNIIIFWFFLKKSSLNANNFVTYLRSWKQVYKRLNEINLRANEHNPWVTCISSVTNVSLSICLLYLSDAELLTVPTVIKETFPINRKLSKLLQNDVVDRIRIAKCSVLHYLAQGRHCSLPRKFISRNSSNFNLFLSLDRCI